MMEPKIRIKEYSGIWKSYKMFDIATFSKGHGYSKSDIKDAGTPIILYGRLYTKYQTSIRDVDTFVDAKEGSCYSKGGEIIIPASGETAEDIACAAVVAQKGIILGGDLNVLSLTEDIVPEIVALTLSYGNAHNDLAKRAQGKTVVHLHNSEIEKAIISIPDNKYEQTAIVLFFERIDDLISKTNSRIASLRQMKAASLQAMFPQKGETKPKVRFKGFDDDWEEKKLGECLEISKENNAEEVYSINDVLSVSDDFGVMNQIELLGRSYAGKSVKNYGVLKKGQIVYTKSPLKSKPYGIIKHNFYQTGIVSVLYAIYEAKESVSAEYIHYYFDPAWRINDYLYPLVRKGAKNTMNISDEDALEGAIMIPSTLEEQQKIANFFTTLDKQISLEEQKLELLKRIKSACLDKMFV